MKIIYTVAFTLVIIFHSIELSGQSNCNSEDERTIIVTRSRPSDIIDGHHSPATVPPPEEPPLSTRSKSPPDEPPVDTRTKSCYTRPQTFQRIYGSIRRCAQLERIRVSPHQNRDLLLELRRYTFPGDKPIQMRLGYMNNAYEPMPTQEQIVLSTSGGDVLAILQETNCLVAIYNRRRVRAKINMNTGIVTKMEPEEVSLCPVGRRIPISANYVVLRASLDLNQ